MWMGGSVILFLLHSWLTSKSIISVSSKLENVTCLSESGLAMGPQITTIDPLCERFPEADTLFSSDNFPGRYKKYTDCTYWMRASRGKHVQLTFFFFDVSWKFSTWNF